MTSQPHAIYVQLTTGCNASCVNCPHPFTYGKQGMHQKGNMSDDVWQQLVAQIKQAEYGNIVGLYLHHEPLLVKSLYDKIEDINRQTKARVSLSTNGALLDRENRMKLVESRPWKVHININSADRDQYIQTMGLDYDSTFSNIRSFIAEAKDRIVVEINCPVLPGVDPGRLVEMFPGVVIHTEHWANSRGGLLKGISANRRATRFNGEDVCRQPSLNCNVLWDGSIIACCMDWTHESKSDFPNIMQTDLFCTFSSEAMTSLQDEFRRGFYRRYKMCQSCALEMGFAQSP